MELNMKSLLASGVLAATVALSGMAQPALADSPVFPGIIVDVNPTPIGPRIRLPTEAPNIIPYPNCPTGFTLAQRGAHIFHCRKTVSPNSAAAATQTANATSCAPVSYWDGAKEVYSSAYNGHLAINFKCHH